MPAIQQIKAREILDSNGWPTLEVEVAGDGFRGRASVPAGTSRGRHEARERRDNDPDRYEGQGVRTAVAGIEQVIAPAMMNREVTNQLAIDQTLIELDGTGDKQKLGGNALLAVSLACAKAAAASRRLPLFQYISQALGGGPAIGFPRLLINCLNGGRHAGNELAPQEYMIVPRPTAPAEAIEIGVHFYHQLRRELVNRYGQAAVNVGFEGGFAPPIQEWRRPFEIFNRVVDDLSLTGQLQFALDAAASEFYRDGLYSLGADEHLDREQLLDNYQQLAGHFPLYAIEDPFQEDDFAGFARLNKKISPRTLIIGDDLTATNVDRMSKACSAGAVGGVIIKPNQIGTLTETLAAVKKARQYGWRVIVSHRSRETNDDFLAHLAVGVAADGLKLGAPARGERLAKYNELLRISELA